jgi:glyceraldehyde 3-phosphate dehydrogenase
VTHSPEPSLIDKSIIMGVNEKTLKKEDYLISSSICDANAFAPTVNVLNKHYGVNHGFITTLHPWLNYQNLLDGASKSFGYPGTTYGQYELGRASLSSLIPKPTSCVLATEKVLPDLKGKFLSVSYRVPTSIVSSCDVSVKLNKNVTETGVTELFKRLEKEQEYKIFHNNFEPLVSIDFVKSNYSAIIDQRWTMVNNDNYLKMILWYDNEWGYSNRVVDLVDYIRCEL